MYIQFQMLFVQLKFSIAFGLLTFYMSIVFDKHIQTLLHAGSLNQITFQVYYHVEFLYKGTCRIWYEVMELIYKLILELMCIAIYFVKITTLYTLNM